MQTVISALENTCHIAGMDGCALVEAQTGMVWHHTGSFPNMEQVGEAAVEYWRTQRRVALALQELGDLRYATFKYAVRTVAIIPCDEDLGLVLVCVAGQNGVDWRQWTRSLPALRLAIYDYATDRKI